MVSYLKFFGHIFCSFEIGCAGACWQQGCQPRPFAAVQLGPGEDIVDFAWNPGLDFAGLFAVCLSKGGVHLLELKGSTVTQVANLPSSTAATCRKFSPCILNHIVISLSKIRDRDWSYARHVICTNNHC